METKFNFKSAICTSREQSEKLLALGLKPETADMCHFWHWESDDYSRLCASWEFAHRSNKDIPAWSLGRLVEMRLDEEYSCGFNLSQGEDAFEKVIRHIEYHIKEGYFNKQYLEE